MKHIRRMNVLEATQDLIQKVAHMLVTDRLGLEQLMQVSLHQALHNVDIFHLIDSRRSNYILNVDYLHKQERIVKYKAS